MESSSFQTGDNYEANPKFLNKFKTMEYHGGRTNSDTISHF